MSSAWGAISGWARGFWSLFALSAAVLCLGALASAADASADTLSIAMAPNDLITVAPTLHVRPDPSTAVGAPTSVSAIIVIRGCRIEPDLADEFT